MAQGYCDKDCKGWTDGQSRGDDYQCGTCGKYTSKSKAPNAEDRVTYKDNGYSAEFVIGFPTPITNMEELRASKKIDETIWNIDRAEFGTSAGYRKDRKVDWEIKDGKVTHGRVEDSGKMLVVPLFSCRVWVSRKTAEIRNRSIVETFIEEAKKHSPVAKKLNYKKSKDGCLLELALPDMQLGRLVAEYETGQELNPKMQTEIAWKVAEKLISYASMFNVSRVLFPIGNDFFNSNNSAMTTAHGTPQTDDARWHLTFKLGASLIVKIIDALSALAPVDVVVVPGNHDEERIWYLGEYLEAWYHKNPNITVDNRPQKRKYYHFGQVLLGLTHGYYEKIQELGSLMAYEIPQLWAQSTHREWHLGDKHHKVDMILKTKELENGVVVRILRSLAKPSVWEFDKGLVGSLKAGELFVWHPVEGLKAQFTETL